MRLIDSITKELRGSVRSRLAGADRLWGLRRPSLGDALDRSAFTQTGLPAALAYLEAPNALFTPPGPVDRSALSAAESRSVARALQMLPTFPANVLNGCQSRAHVTFLELDAAAPGKIHKVWLLSGSLLSPHAGSSIDYALPGGRVSRWKYHVAVAYTAANGQSVVVDTLMSPRPQQLDLWTRRFSYRGFAVAAFTSGHSYSFMVSPRVFRGISCNVLTGFFDYSGVTQQSRDGAKAIAADALALAFAEGKYRGCSWAQHRADAISLIGAASPYLPYPTWEEASASDWASPSLYQDASAWTPAPLALPTRSEPPDDCREAFALFRDQVETWTAIGL
jgi:Glutaminase